MCKRLRRACHCPAAYGNLGPHRSSSTSGGSVVIPVGNCSKAPPGRAHAAGAWLAILDAAGCAERREFTIRKGFCDDSTISEQPNTSLCEYFIRSGKVGWRI